MHMLFLTLGLLIASPGPDSEARPAEESLRLELKDGHLSIHRGALQIARYVFRDPDIPRPYFAHVKTPGGVQATRTHPPVEGVDATDHATMHPGIWMAFGDIDGEDTWRLRASIRHVKFVEPPRVKDGKVTFTEEKRYVASDGSEICREIFRWKLHVSGKALLMEWDSTFRSDRDFYFGDQEEIGLGVRVASPVTEKSGGLLRDSEGRRKAHKIWSQAARWCDYGGEVDGRPVGITVFAHPENFRPSWWHARNYGFMAANPFGRKAMKKGDTSKVVVRKGESLRLRFGIWIHESNPEKTGPIQEAYESYLKLAEATPALEKNK